MRGSPIKEWVIFSILWLLLLIPVIKLTGSRKPSIHTPADQQMGAATLRQVAATVVIRYTGKPQFINIIQHEKTLAQIVAPPAGETERNLTLSSEDDGVEIRLQAEWADDQEHVIEIELIQDKLETRKIHLWARQKLDEVAYFD